jgi:hypothetical protein
MTITAAVAGDVTIVCLQTSKKGVKERTWVLLTGR